MSHKRVRWILAALATAAVLTGCASAAGDTAKSGDKEDLSYDFSVPEPEEVVLESEKEKTKWKIPGMGMDLTLPDEYKNCKGNFIVGKGQEIYPGDGVMYVSVSYLGRGDNELENLNKQLLEPDEDMTEETMSAMVAEYYTPCRVLFSIYAIDDHRGLDELNAYFEDMYGSKPELVHVKDLGENCGYHYYFTQMPVSESEGKEQLGEEFFNDYLALYKKPDLCIKNLDLYLPQETELEESDKLDLSFTTFDMEGNPVNGETLIPKNKVTVINLWATYADPCIEDMLELETLYEEYKDKGCGFVGFCGDVEDDDSLLLAMDIIEATGTTYQECVPSVNFDLVFSPQVYPTTYFVDSKGYLIGGPVYGSDPEQYRKKIEKVLGDEAEEDGKKGKVDTKADKDKKKK